METAPPLSGTPTGDVEPADFGSDKRAVSRNGLRETETLRFRQGRQTDEQSRGIHGVRLTNFYAKLLCQGQTWQVVTAGSHGRTFSASVFTSSEGCCRKDCIVGSVFSASGSLPWAIAVNVSMQRWGDRVSAVIASA